MAAQMARTFVKCYINFERNNVMFYIVSTKQTLQTVYDKLPQTLCKLHVTILRGAVHLFYPKRFSLLLVGADLLN